MGSQWGLCIIQNNRDIVFLQNMLMLTFAAVERNF